MRLRCLAPLLIAAYYSCASLAQGAQFARTNEFRLQPQETLATELWLSANRIQLEGIVADDIFMLASKRSFGHDDPQDGLITLAGEYHNDVWAAANSIEFTGRIEDHARCLARTIMLSGYLANNSIFIGETIHCSKAAEVAADIWMVGENIILDGKIAGRARLFGRNITLAGTFDQDVFITAQDIVALPGTEILGNLTYRCAKEFVPDSRVIIHGQLIRQKIGDSAEGPPLAFSIKTFFYQSWLYLGALLAGIIFIALFPTCTTKAVLNIQGALWSSLLTGAATLALIVTAIFFGMLSFIGIPLSLLLILTCIILIYFSKIIVAIALGSWLLRRSQPRCYRQFLLPLAIGLLLIYAGINRGPLGLTLGMLISILGLGALVRACYANQAQKLPETCASSREDSLVESAKDDQAG